MYVIRVSPKKYVIKKVTFILNDKPWKYPNFYDE
jgi:hypothetical protein